MLFRTAQLILQGGVIGTAAPQTVLECSLGGSLVSSFSLVLLMLSGLGDRRKMDTTL